jgi:hypothetical protein
MDKRVRILPIVMLLCLPLLSLVPMNSEAVCPSYPWTSIRLVQSKQTAYVAPGQDGMVTFTGEVILVIPYQENETGYMVTLTPEAGDWVVSGPSVIIFEKASKYMDFTVSVCVPTGTSQSTIYQLTVTGKWSSLGGDRGGFLDPATALIFVKQYTQVELDSPHSLVSINQGNGFSTHIQVHNRGNGRDSLRVELSNLKELENQGWEVYFEPDKIEIEENCSSMINISMNSSKKVELGIFNVNFSVIRPECECPDQHPPYNYTLFVKVKERELLGIKYKIWIAFEWTMIAILGIVTAFLVIVKKKLTRLAYSKLSRTLE